MRTVVQRVSSASVTVHEEGYEAKIGNGLLILAAFIEEDTEEDNLRKCAEKAYRRYSGRYTSILRVASSYPPKQ